MRTALYRHFDAAGALLYVGISLNSIQRTAQHKHGALFVDWQRVDIATRADGAKRRIESLWLSPNCPRHGLFAEVA